jgi:hypothetical protein
MRASVVLPHWRGPEDGHARMRAEQVENVGNIAVPCSLWKFPSLDKEGWRAAPGWFETAIPQFF